MLAGKEQKDRVSRTGRDEGRKLLQVSQNYQVTAGLEINLSQTTWQIYTTLGLMPGGWKVGVSFSECSFISVRAEDKISILKSLMTLYSQGKHEIYIDMVTYASYLMARTSIFYCNRKCEWGFVNNTQSRGLWIYS